MEQKQKKDEQTRCKTPKQHQIIYISVENSSGMGSIRANVKARELDQVAQSTLDHFSSLALARPTLEDPNFHVANLSRTVTDDGHGHTLMGKTWNTPTTIKHLLSLYRHELTATGPSIPLGEQTPEERAEVRRFYTFGEDLNAHPDLLHGGVIGCVLDSTLGNAIGLASRLRRYNGPMFTVQLNVTYKKPVRTPGTIMARSWVTKIEDGGRKVWAEGVIESLGEEGETIMHATAEGMWVGRRTKQQEKL